MTDVRKALLCGVGVGLAILAPSAAYAGTRPTGMVTDRADMIPYEIESALEG